MRITEKLYFYVLQTCYLQMAHLRSFLGFLVLYLISLSGISQTYDIGNQWYNPGLTYKKLLVWKDGIYRVTASDINLSGVNPVYLHLIYRGVEVPIFVSNSGNVTEFDGSDFFEFFGRKNNGFIDSLLYRHPQTGLQDAGQQPNIYHSIFTDTSAYFLTWDNLPGLRMQNYLNTNYASLTVQPSFKHRALLEYNTSYYQRGGGSIISGGATDYYGNSDYITGEGYTGYNIGQSFVSTVPTPYIVPNSASPTVLARIFGLSDTPHSLTIKAGTAQQTFSYNRITINTFSLSANASDITPATNITFTSGASSTTTDNNLICWVQIEYQRQFKFNSDKVFSFLWDQLSTNSYFIFENIGHNDPDSGFVYDVTNGIRAKGTINGSDLHVIVPKTTGTSVEYWVTDGSSIQSPLIQDPSLANLANAAGAEFVIITHRSLKQSAESYATYRDTNTVNRLSTKIVYVDEIYDEFGYGSTTALAIKRFCYAAATRWQTKPKFFFLWGKGLFFQRESGANNLVPTYGFPASDIMYVCKFNPDQKDYTPIIPIGRMNVRNDEEGLSFLNKMIEYEHAPFDIWKKQGLHLGGGKGDGEQQSIRSFLEGRFEPIFESQPLGGSIFYSQKTSNVVIGNDLDVRSLIDSGVVQITFFGHSTSNIFDVQLEPVQVYNNHKKYPVIIANGCYSGDFASSIYRSFGEDFLLTPAKGAIAYISSSSTGYIGPLGQHTEEFYKAAYRDSIGRAIGTQMQVTIHQFIGTQPNTNQLYLNHAMQINLQGDPAMRIAVPKMPDLAITPASIYFSPDNISTQVDSFTVNVIVQNKGTIVDDTFMVSIRQLTGSGSWVDHGKHPFTATHFWDTLSIRVKNPGMESAGINQFDIFVDALDTIPESDETNNRVMVEKSVPANIPYCLFPIEFAVINRDTVSLVASTYGVTPNLVNYLFEIDTVIEFTSPRLSRSPVVSGTAIQGSWFVPFTLIDSTVYYWRVRLADDPQAQWAYSSFKYIKNIPHDGWAQSKPPQFFEKNITSGIFMDKDQREWAFDPIKSNIQISMNQAPGFNSYDYYLNGSSMVNTQNAQGISAGIIYQIFDKNTLKPKLYDFNIYNCELARIPEQMNAFVNILNTMNQGDYIVMLGVGNPRVPQYSQALFAALNGVGVSNTIRNVPDNVWFGIVGQKGAPMGAAVEAYDFNRNYKIELRYTMYSNTATGIIKSPLIGPGIVWDELIWNWDAQEQGVSDQTKVSVWGVQRNGQEDKLLENLPRGSHDLSLISPTMYPQLRLRADVSDSLYRTAPQLKHWHILYSAVPEAVLDPKTNFQFYSTTVEEGDSMHIQLTARNISNLHMDSLLVRYVVRKADRTEVLLAEYFMDSLRAQKEYSFRYSFSSSGLVGENTLIVTINPDRQQPEQYLFNNVYYQKFQVLPDVINPILDVTFDGRHITDGDIVSPIATITMDVNDENKYLALTDTTAIEVFFKSKDDPTPAKRVFFGDGRMVFVPATMPENRAQVIFRPGPLPNGDYVLEAQGFDVRKNLSGEKLRYQISFKVINESTITNIFNYPNPFSTSTKFVYTLTGSLLPEVFKIQIFTISGKYVKEIDLKSLGELRIGNTMTNYSWDGTDEFGDRLANGVYLYRTLIRMPNEVQLKMNNDKTKKFFDNGWGKMVIIR